MPEYIERNAIRDMLYDADAINFGGLSIINLFPAADVTPVVYCRDCKHWDTNSGECCRENSRPVMPSIWYCAGGVRRA